MPDLRRQELRVPGLNEPISHYTDAVRFGNTLFVSGMGPLAEDRLARGRRRCRRTGAAGSPQPGRGAQGGGASPADVLKVTVYLTDIGDRALINPVRREFFGEARPASTLVEVSALAIPGMKVEIEAVVGLPA
jgi:enamine deaminase RidA (YjgF/YER057c/UK114 family)